MSRRGRNRSILGLLALVVLAWGGCGGSPSAPPPAPKPVAYTALGASDAVGIGAFPLRKGYVYLLADRMEAVRSPVTLVNLGINGARIEEFLNDELPRAVASNPDVVTLWAGANDVIGGETADVFAAGLDRLLGELRSRTRALVFVGDLPDLTQAPLFRVAPDADVTRERVDAFNQAIRERVQAHGAILVPLSTMPLDSSTFSIDGFHPSNTGHERIANLYWQQIAPRL